MGIPRLPMFVPIRSQSIILLIIIFLFVTTGSLVLFILSTVRISQGLRDSSFLPSILVIRLSKVNSLFSITSTFETLLPLPPMASVHLTEFATHSYEITKEVSRLTHIPLITELTLTPDRYCYPRLPPFLSLHCSR